MFLLFSSKVYKSSTKWHNSNNSFQFYNNFYLGDPSKGEYLQFDTAELGVEVRSSGSKLSNLERLEELERIVLKKVSQK